MIIEPAEELVYSVTQTDETCAGLCDGTIALTVSGGTGTISVNWSQGTTGTELTGLCSDGYLATIQDANGCAAELEVDIAVGQPVLNSVFITSGPFGENDPPVQLVNSLPGGNYYTTDCSDCLTASGVFDPSVAGAGTYEICYSPPGNCATMNCQTFIVNPCVPQQSEETIYICEGDSALIFGNWQYIPDLFSHTFQGAHCDSIHQIKLLYYNTPDLFTSMTICEGDSISLFGNWIDTTGTISHEAISSQGCSYTNYFTITETFCPEKAIIYIPNSFTPNNDQVNDVFRIELIGGTVEEGFIFNRWGEIIARFDSETLTWDGKSEDGKPSPDGVYTYLVRYSPIGGTTDQIVGHVDLLR